jgi:hypothetical protein
MTTLTEQIREFGFRAEFSLHVADVQTVGWRVYRDGFLAAEPEELLVVDYTFHIFSWPLQKFLTACIAEP